LAIHIRGDAGGVNIVAECYPANAEFLTVVGVDREWDFEFAKALVAGTEYNF